jgi:hypothetical protein
MSLFVARQIKPVAAMKPLCASSCRGSRLMALGLVLAVAALTGPVAGQEKPGAAAAWTERETRLANEYLALLAEQPDEGRVLDLLWQLYESHQETGLLIRTLAEQAKARPHPAVTLIHGHLLKKQGDVAAAAALYESVLKQQGGNRHALRAAARAAAELGQREVAMRHYEALAKVLEAGGTERTAAWLEAGDLALGAEQLDKAAGFWEQAAGEQPASLEVARQVAQRLLQAGLSARAAVFFKALAEKADPREKLAALLDLARIQAHADQFEAADAALGQGMAMVHFRDARHAEFFRQRVRLHERFGRLEELRGKLEASVAKASMAVREAALHELLAFHTLTVNAEERLTVLRQLVEAAPQEEGYRWEWVRAILDQGEVAEAKAWLDAKLAARGSRAPVGWVLLRCEADLRSGEPEAAAARLQELVEAAQGQAELEKEVLTFAQQRALDTVVERVLRGRVEREPGRSEAVFELAGHLRGRQQEEAARAVLDAYVAGAGKTEVERQRLAEVTAFLVGGSDLEGALVRARKAATLREAGREEWLRLADLLVDRGEVKEAQEWMEKAWQAATTDEERLEVDERLVPVLMGPAAAGQPARQVEFKLPSVFTGSQFASEDPPEKTGPTEAMKAQFQRVLGEAKAAGGKPEQRLRAAWWALRCGELEAAYEMLRALALDPVTGADVELSLEAENLLLELAQTDENRALAGRVLRRLAQRDPANRTRYILREVELMLEGDQQRREVTGRQEVGGTAGTGEPLGQEAVRRLRGALVQEPLNELLLFALSRILILQRQPEAALTLWQEAAGRAAGAAAIPLLERQAELQLSLQDLKGHIETGLRMIELETDVGRRREAFKRFMDRLTAADSTGRELEPSVVRDRLTMVAAALTAAAARRPFDGFYPEAQAQVHLRAEDPVAAFAAMKRAYYTAPETPFSLDQLRDAALGVEDMALAVYFQKQIAAAAAPGEVSKESRFLVELLERDFQIEEADQIRRRLERRFSQDVQALAGLAKHYEETGQDEAQRRVLEQVVRVRPWDGRARLELALHAVKLADAGAAREHLEHLLQTLPVKAGPGLVPAWANLALPVTNSRAAGKRGAAGDVAEWLETVSGIEADELEALRTYLRLLRPEFARLPEAPEVQRLRAIEELARLNLAAGGEALRLWHERWKAVQADRPVEALWALYYSEAPGVLAEGLDRLLGREQGLEAAFARVWLLLRGHQMEAAVAWVKAAGTGPEGDGARRLRLMQACVLALVDVKDFTVATGEMERLAAAKLLPNTTLLEITRKMQDRQRYEPALVLGEWLRQHARTLSADYALMMAEMAESAERWDLARHYLNLAVQAPTPPGRYQGVYDPFLSGVGALAQTAQSRQEKEAALQRAWSHLQKTPASDMTQLRRAAVAGLAGAQAQAVKQLDRWVRQDFLGGRPVGQRPGGLMPQGSVRFEEAPQAQSLWEETREIGALLTQQGLAGVSAEAERQLLARWGTVQLGPRPGYEFNELRIAHLIRSMRQTDHANRLRLIRQWLAPVDMRAEASVELLGELGAKLETVGMSREAVAVYKLLPERAPTNSEYAQWLLRASEAAREVEPGKSFSIQLINAVPPFKPPTPGDDALRELHAKFLAMDFDVAMLRQRAFRESRTLTLAGRLPPETAYLRELGRLLERLGMPEEALKAWERYHDCFVHHDDDGLEPDMESALRRGRILAGQGKKEAALALLRAQPAAENPGVLEHEALLLEAELTAERGEWDALRLLMLRAVERHDAGTVIALSQVLRKHGRVTEALNLLTQAERRSKENAARFRLRLAQVEFLQAERNAGIEVLQSRMTAVFRSGAREADAEKRLLDWMGELAQQDGGGPAGEWVAYLLNQTRAGPDRVLAGAALCCWAAHWVEDHSADVRQAWREAAKTDADRRCIEAAAARLLAAGRAEAAWEAAVLAGDLPTLRRQGRLLPVMVEAAHQLGREHGVSELFAEVVHMPVPGGTRVAEWAAAFERAGRAELARELLEAALRHAKSTESLSGALAVEWVRFLTGRGEHAAAESFLLKHDYLLVQELPELLHGLYASWKRLPELPEQVRRFRLATGIEKEVLWRAGGLKP